MKTIRRFLYPFSLLYQTVTSIRNYFFDKGIYASKAYEIPVIAVGNLSVGGTGKTPQIEYLIRLLTQHNYKIATVSRGYKRKTKGMIVANTTHTAADLGDEPFQFYTKFPKVTVVANGNRVEAIDFLLKQADKPDVVLLDDAMQHRKVSAGFYVMLTAFNDFFYDDLVLPAGNLRESRYGATRASCIVVTKCPTNISEADRHFIISKINQYVPQTPVYFSEIVYDNYVYNESNRILISSLDTNYIAVAGIAKPEPFFSKLQKGNILTIPYPDHYDFKMSDVSDILQKASGRKIITTEKDYMRLKGKISDDQLYYLPIETSFLFNEASIFNKQIFDFVTN
jgi:tetraacyldisaccharide 4'-kinase